MISASRYHVPFFTDLIEKDDWIVEYGLLALEVVLPFLAVGRPSNGLQPEVDVALAEARQPGSVEAGAFKKLLQGH